MSFFIREWMVENKSMTINVCDFHSVRKVCLYQFNNIQVRDNKYPRAEVGRETRGYLSHAYNTWFTVIGPDTSGCGETYHHYIMYRG